MKKKIHREQTICYICKKEFSINNKTKNIKRLEIIVISLENIEELLLILVI